MSKANLHGRQSQVERPDAYVVGGFEDDGRQVVKKTYKSGKPADKPSFFMGGCDPTVPTGPKRKLRASWLADAPTSTPVAPPVPTPTKRWTPLNKRNAPPRSKSHDGTVSSDAFGSGEPRRGKKPGASTAAADDESHKQEVKEEEQEEESSDSQPPVPVEEKKDEAPKLEKEEEPLKPAAPASKVVVHPYHTKKVEKEPAKIDTSQYAYASPVLVRKPVQPTEHCKQEIQQAMQSDNNDNDNDKASLAAPSSSSGPDCTACHDKDTLIQQLRAELDVVKHEKGELAKQVKKIKGSAHMNGALKEEIAELKQQLAKKEQANDNSKKFHKLENKLNTLKMMMDSHVDKNDIMALKEHVDMLTMILNQDLKKEGMKNVWA